MMNSNKIEPLISIVIPTRNRQKYCIAAIEDILSYDYANFQLCIQDNSDTNELEEYILNKESDSRLVYKRISESLPSTVNIGSSIDLASGKYVILIGDDDTILPSIFSAVQYMDENDIDSLCPKPIIDYFWPGAHPIHKDGYLIIKPQSFKYEEDKLFKQKLDQAIKNGMVRYLTLNLPRLYHGIVKRDVLLKIKDKAGHYAGGVSPDSYLTVGISHFCENHYTCDFSVSIAGGCSSSATAQGAHGKHVGDLKDAPHMRGRNNYQWSDRVPYYYSVDTVWAESALKAIEELDLKNLNEIFGSNYLTAYSLIHNYSIFPYAFKQSFFKDKGFRKYTKMIKVFSYMPLFGFKFIFLFFQKKQQRQNNIYKYVYNVGSISDAVSNIVKNTKI